MSDLLLDHAPHPPAEVPAASSAPIGTVTRHGRGVRLERSGRSADLHPLWLRDRSQEPGAVDATSRQRLFTPVDIAPDLAVTDCHLDDTGLAVAFSDGHRARLDLARLLRDLGWAPDDEAPPAAQPWDVPVAVPRVDWAGIGWDRADGDPDAVLAMLDAFYRNGFVVLHGVGTAEQTVARVADRLGYLSGDNFGWVFDVQREDRPADLAYTSIGLLAHTDQPYRHQPPAIQLLHCLANAATGADSTLADGLAASRALQAEAPNLHRALTQVEVEFRYDVGTDTVVGTRPVLDLDGWGRLRGVHLNTKLDTPLPRDGVDLDAWYAGRRRLMEWTNDPAHQVRLHLEAGEVMVFDNHRILHGRSAFDAAGGRRHLQGCYIGHEGPDTLYRLTVRRRTARTS